MKRPKLSNKFPCQCGHKRVVHSTSPLYMGGDTWCLGDTVKDSLHDQFSCFCEKYIPDNLKYLEQISKKRGK